MDKIEVRGKVAGSRRRCVSGGDGDGGGGRSGGGSIFSRSLSLSLSLSLSQRHRELVAEIIRARVLERGRIRTKSAYDRCTGGVRELES